jgi:predicted DNA-binding transcriptional regulator
MKSRRGSRGTGLSLFISSIISFIVYAYLLLATEWGIIVLRLTVLAGIAAILAVLAWIGYTMATTQESDKNSHN